MKSIELKGTLGHVSMDQGHGNRIRLSLRLGFEPEKDKELWFTAVVESQLSDADDFTEMFGIESWGAQEKKSVLLEISLHPKTRSGDDGGVLYYMTELHSIALQPDHDDEPRWYTFGSKIE